MHRLLITFAIVGFFVAIECLFTDGAKPRDMTLSAMTETAARIGIYFRNNQKLPANLSVLPVREGYANNIVDDRKRPLKYTVTGNDSFTLSTVTMTDEADAFRKYSIVNGEIVWPR